MYEINQNWPGGKVATVISCFPYYTYIYGKQKMDVRKKHIKQLVSI